MSKYETGFYKGEEIMTVCDKDLRWTDRGNNVFIERELDEDWHSRTDTFYVAERLRGNRHQIWAKGLNFEDARDLAERLVVGADYVPPSREKLAAIDPEFKVDDVIPGYLRHHHITDEILNQLYESEVKNRIPHSGLMASLLHDKLKDTPTKQAKILEVAKNGKLTIGYFYGGSCYTGNLVRRGK